MTATRYETKTVFDYPWKQVVQAYWNRYPNPSSTHVLTEDTISREVRDGKLYSRRILSKTNPVPRWGERFCKNSTVKILEDSILDPAKKTLTTFTRNIGYIKIMRVDEIVEYSEQKDGKTLAVRTAFISSQVFGFSRAIRAFGVERFKSNCNKAAIGFNHVLRKMYPQTVSMLTSSDQIGGSINQLQQQQQQHQHHHSGKKDALKRAGQATYEYFKAHAGKLAQMFSVKN